MRTAGAQVDDLLGFGSELDLLEKFPESNIKRAAFELVSQSIEVGLSHPYEHAHGGFLCGLGLSLVRVDHVEEVKKKAPYCHVVHDGDAKISHPNVKDGWVICCCCDSLFGGLGEIKRLPVVVFWVFHRC